MDIISIEKKIKLDEIDQLPKEVLILQKEIKEIVLEKDKEILKTNKKIIDDLVTKIKSSRDVFYKKQKEDEKLIISLEKTLKDKKKEADQIIELLEKEDKEQRVLKCKDYYENFASKEVKEIIDFETEIFDKTFEAESNYKNINKEPNKKIKDIIESKVNRIQTELDIIENEDIKNFYIENGKDLPKAIAKHKELLAFAQKQKTEVVKPSERPATPIEKCEKAELTKITIEIFHDTHKSKYLKKYLEDNVMNILDEKGIIANLRMEEI